MKTIRRMRRATQQAAEPERVIWKRQAAESVPVRVKATEPGSVKRRERGEA